MSKPKIEIIYQDNDIIVINKPSGVSVTKDRSGMPELLDFLAGQLEPQICRQLRLVHRLDKDTSGVMILAKTAEAQSQFSSWFEKRLVKKTYLALVTGIISGYQGTIKTSIVRSRKNPALMCTTGKKGKEAVTEWKLLADFGTIALLAVKPITGRTHQIRLHLTSIGLPLAIDPLYGSPRALFLSDFKADYRLARRQTEKPLIERLTLHAYQLSFQAQPQDEPRNLIDNSFNRPAIFIAALDKKFAATIKMLTKHNPKGQKAFSPKDSLQRDPDAFSKIINAKPL